MSKIICAGDWILDEYRLCSATRICPEAPVPVLVPQKPSKRESPGGCALVAAQLKEILGNDSVETVTGSISRKERIFADGHLVCRIDFDGTVKTPDFLRDRVLELLTDANPPDLLVISDYGKGALNAESAKRIMDMAASKEVPVLVDAKHSWLWYRGAFAAFPNERETFSSVHLPNTHVIQKLGERGCMVDGEIVPPAIVKEVDCTGAGDVFIAAFAARLVTVWNLPEVIFRRPDQLQNKIMLMDAAHYANKVAGKSVEFFGTHTVTKSEIEEEYCEST